MSTVSARVKKARTRCKFTCSLICEVPGGLVGHREFFISGEFPQFHFAFGGTDGLVFTGIDDDKAG